MFWHNSLHYDAVLCIVLVYHAVVVGNGSLRPFSVVIALLSYQATVHYTVYTHTFAEMVMSHSCTVGQLYDLWKYWLSRSWHYVTSGVMSSNHEQVCSYIDLVCMDVVFRLGLFSRSTWHTRLHIFGKSYICVVWLVSELFCMYSSWGPYYPSKL